MCAPSSVRGLCCLVIPASAVACWLVSGRRLVLTPVTSAMYDLAAVVVSSYPFGLRLVQSFSRSCFLTTCRTTLCVRSLPLKIIRLSTCVPWLTTPTRCAMASVPQPQTPIAHTRRSYGSPLSPSPYPRNPKTQTALHSQRIVVVLWGRALTPFLSFFSVLYAESPLYCGCNLNYYSFQFPPLLSIFLSCRLPAAGRVRCCCFIFFYDLKCILLVLSDVCL